MTRRRRSAAGRRARAAYTPAVDETSRRLRLWLQLALLIAALVAILAYGGTLAERAAGCTEEIATPESQMIAP